MRHKLWLAYNIVGALATLAALAWLVYVLFYPQEYVIGGY